MEINPKVRLSAISQSIQRLGGSGVGRWVLLQIFVLCAPLVCSNFCHNVIVKHPRWEMFVGGSESVSILAIKLLFNLNYVNLNGWLGCKGKISTVV